MDKRIITINVDKNTTQDEIKEIRDNFKIHNKDCHLNILISGKDDIRLSLGNFLAERLKLKYCENSDRML